MIFRFCTYGFLKNQKYFEPFLLLSFIDRGLSFTDIGFIIAFREVCINLMEIPTGAMADLLGRRKSMIFSFISYIIAMLIFGLTIQIWPLYIAMFLFSIGEAFRTGTHKSIIFEWLTRDNRSNEKIEVYGQTRSWSKLGSAISMPIAATALFAFEKSGFSVVFLLATIPYLLNIINFTTYPAYLDGDINRKGDKTSLLKQIKSSICNSFKSISMRRTLLESMGYEGCFKASKDYLQPILQAFALSMPLLLWMSDQQRTAVVVASVYAIIYLLGSIASRNAGKFTKMAGGELNASKLLWSINLVTYLILGVSIYYNCIISIVLSFVIAALFQNFWRPILISRCATLCNPKERATVLSIESQTKSLFVALVAPLLGWLIDYIAIQSPNVKFMPIAILGALISLIILLWKGKSKS